MAEATAFFIVYLSGRIERGKVYGNDDGDGDDQHPDAERMYCKLEYYYGPDWKVVNVCTV